MGLAAASSQCWIQLGRGKREARRGGPAVSASAGTQSWSVCFSLSFSVRLEHPGCGEEAPFTAEEGFCQRHQSLLRGWGLGTWLSQQNACWISLSGEACLVN